MKIAVIKYNAGNVLSVNFALARAGVEGVLTDDPEEIRSADRVLFPGVGEAGSAMRFLKEKNLDKLIVTLKQPVLGICLGMQLLCKHSDESNTDCLGIFDAVVKKFPIDKGFKIPQIGWNNIFELKSKLFEGISEQVFFYFVHGYYVPDNNYAIAKANYVFNYAAAIQKENFFAVQFHPEKSGAEGQKVITNFLNIK
jgi:glutamine amidotransferase